MANSNFAIVNATLVKSTWCGVILLVTGVRWSNNRTIKKWNKYYWKMQELGGAKKKNNNNRNIHKK